MSTLYRIRAVAPDQYVVERKGWLFWHTALFEWGFINEKPTRFSSPERAKEALQKSLNRKDKIKQHISQKPIYFWVNNFWVGP